MARIPQYQQRRETFQPPGKPRVDTAAPGRILGKAIGRAGSQAIDAAGNCSG